MKCIKKFFHKQHTQRTTMSRYTCARVCQSGDSCLWNFELNRHKWFGFGCYRWNIQFFSILRIQIYTTCKRMVKWFQLDWHFVFEQKFHRIAGAVCFAYAQHTLSACNQSDHAFLNLMGKLDFFVQESGRCDCMKIVRISINSCDGVQTEIVDEINNGESFFMWMFPCHQTINNKNKITTVKNIEYLMIKLLTEWCLNCCTTNATKREWNDCHHYMCNAQTHAHVWYSYWIFDYVCTPKLLIWMLHWFVCVRSAIHIDEQY